jgi:cell division protein FtsB
MDLRIKRVSRPFGVSIAERGRKAVAKQAPQLQMFAGGIVTRLRPASLRLYEARRRLATIGVAVFTVWLFLHVMFGANGMVVYRQKRAEYVNLQNEINSQQNENKRYTDQIQALKTDPKTIEKEAREQLHYTRPGEVVYVPPAPVQVPDTSSAKK